MPSYNAPLRDIKFVMQEMLNVESLTEYENFAEADMDTLDAILEQSAKFSSEVLAPLNVVGCLLYTSPSPRDGLLSRMPSSA